MDHGCIQYVFLIHVLYSSQFTVQVKVLPDPVRNVDEIPLTTICYDHDTQNNIGENSASFHANMVLLENGHHAA